jgi:DNA-binding MarR family transcriptional regulator
VADRPRTGRTVNFGRQVAQTSQKSRLKCVADQPCVTAQTMQAIVTNLERDGFILRHADPSHGRILRTGLTDHGREALIQADQVVFDVESAMIRSLSEGEVATLINLLGRCGENLSSDE